LHCGGASDLKLTVKSPGGAPSPPSSPRGPSCDCVGAAGTVAASSSASASSSAGFIPTALAELDLDYGRRYSGVRIPDAYERLIADAIAGDASNFVRGDFVATAWRVFDPFLAASEAPGAPPPLRYAARSRGPPEADELARREGFRRTEGYTWRVADDPAPAKM
jgi:hypothetical protein